MGRQKIHRKHGRTNNVWKTLKSLCILRTRRVKDGTLTPSSYALTKVEKEIFFECLSSIKVPSGFSSNIKGIINMAEKKIPKPEVS